MREERQRRIKTAHKAEIDDMAKHGMSEGAARQARRRPYCCDMIRNQEEQLRETPAEYVARKYNIRGDGYGSGDCIPSRRDNGSGNNGADGSSEK